MKITSIKITDESRNKLNHYTKRYNQKSVSEFINFIFNYIERNEIDLNLDLNNGTYNTIKEFDKKIENLESVFEKESIKKGKRIEHLISIVMNIEKEYFFPLKEQGLLKVATKREMKEDLIYKDVLQNLIPKIKEVYAEKLNKNIYRLDITEPEFKILLNYARKF